MSFTEEKRQKVKRYILEKIDGNQKNLAKRTAEAFDLSLNTVYRYLRELEQDKIIVKTDNKYKFVQQESFVSLSRTRGELEEEDAIYMRHVKPYMQNLPENVRRIWEYAFTEMMNNAIDHSEAEHVDFLIFQNYLTTTIYIEDDGIGIFKKIQKYYSYETLDDAVNELFKGKLTTDRRNHSGEGIFFTSRVLDRFAAISDEKIFTHNKYIERPRNLEEISSLEELKGRSGTVIFMNLSNFSKKILKEVFDMFADVEGGFTRTHIPMKNIYEMSPVSRSQAKRLCNGFEKFREVELDFEGIEEIGQGFAHELFVVFQSNHPDVRLLPLHMTREVERMIHHVKQSAM